MNFAEVKAITIPEGNVKQISIGDQVVWKKVAGVLATKTVTVSQPRMSYIQTPTDTGLQLLANETYTINYDMSCEVIPIGVYACALTLMVIGDSDVNTIRIGNDSAYSTSASGTVEFTPTATGNIGLFGQYFGNGGTVNLTVTGMFIEE